MYNYDGLKNTLKEHGLKRSDLSKLLGISSRTIAKIEKGERLSKYTIGKIAGFLKCDPSRLVRYVSDNNILQILRDEKDAKVSGGLYHELQIRMAYNSNHIEGSRLTEEQTRMIFETDTVDMGEGIPVDDILETIHHFRAIDYVIDIAENALTEDMIKHIHCVLKHDTKDSDLPWFAVGEYKKRPNMVGGKETVKPDEVAVKMKELLDNYNQKENVGIEDIIEFHADFEYIHPFQDGNGRVGRLIALKECLHHNTVPFIIEDSKKLYYYRGLSEWKEEKGWLTDTCLDGQDTFRKLAEQLGVMTD